MFAMRTPANSGARPRCRSASPAASYVARHGQGYSRFEHTSHGIALELLQYVPLDDPIKISRLKITQPFRPRAAAFGHRLCRMGAGPVARRRRAVHRHRNRRGDRRDAGAQSVEHRFRIACRVRRSRRPADCPGPATGREFHRPQRLARPAAALAGRGAAVQPVGAGLDPCGALQTRMELPANGTTEIVFLLGETATPRRGAGPD